MNFNIKKLSLVLTLVMVVSFSLSAILFDASGVSWADFWSFNNLNDINLEYKNNIDQEKLFALEDINKINVHTVSSNINYIRENRDDIKVVFSGSVASSSNPDLPKMIAEKSGNALDVEIKYPQGINLGVNIVDINIDIFLPQSFSGDIDMKTTSGNVNIDTLDVDSFYFTTISGDLKAKNLYSQKSHIKSTSGKANIQDFKGALDFESISGDLSVAYNEFYNDIKIDSTSGNAEIILPVASSFYLKAKTVSGDINCDFPLTLEGQIDKRSINGKVGDGKKNISISTVSGNIDITK